MKWKNILKEIQELTDNDNKKIKAIIDNFNNGSIKIEFMIKNNIVELVVLFDDKLRSLLNISGSKPKYFKSSDALLNYIYSNFGTRYGFSDMNAVAKEIFDYKEMKHVFDQINVYIENYPLKAQSLTYDISHAKPGEKNSSWDMEVIFRRSSEKMSRTSSDWKIHPTISGNKEIGKIIGKDEIEVTTAS